MVRCRGLGRGAEREGEGRRVRRPWAAALAPPRSFLSPPLPTPRLQGPRPTSGLWACRRPQGACGGGRKGRGAPEPQQEEANPPAIAGPARVLALDPAMWGLLLALATFAPAVGLSLGASGASVLGLASPATTEAPVSTPAPRSSQAELSAGNKNGELPTHGPLLPQAGCPTPLPPVWRPLPSTRTHTTHTPHTPHSVPSACVATLPHAHTLPARYNGC